MEADVIVSWGFASVPDAVKELFTRPTRFVVIPTPANRGYKSQVEGLGWPFPVRTAIRKYAPGVEPLRVALLGFSESCHGLRNLLSSADGALVDSVIAIDGIHTPWIQPGNKVDPNTMKAWFEFAKLAIVNERLFVDTHSSVVPPSFASTTQTADWLWQQLTSDEENPFGSPPFTVPPVPNLVAPPTAVKVGVPPAKAPYTVEYPAAPWQPPKRAQGLVILGCDNLDKPAGYADHIYQAKAILPLVLEKFLVNRWNSMDPKAPGQSCFIAGTPGRGGRPGGAVGSAMDSKCAATSVWSPGLIDAPTQAYLPGMAPNAEKSKQTSLLASAVLVGAGVLGLWWMSQQPEYRDNPPKREWSTNERKYWLATYDELRKLHPPIPYGVGIYRDEEHEWAKSRLNAFIGDLFYLDATVYRHRHEDSYKIFRETTAPKVTAQIIIEMEGDRNYRKRLSERDVYLAPPAGSRERARLGWA